MVAYIDGSEEHVDIDRHILITVGETHYKISLNKFDELVINKQHYGADTTSITIMPYMSNEIRIL